MKQPNVLLKLAVVASSVLLVGGFVSYRAGAFNRFSETSAPPTGSEPSLTFDQSLLSGSKSEIIFREPAASQQPPAVTGQPTPTIMGGPKYKAPLIDPFAPDTPAPLQQPPPPTAPPAPAAPAIMSGSKSLAPLVIPPAPITPNSPPPSASQPSKPSQ